MLSFGVASGQRILFVRGGDATGGFLEGGGDPAVQTAHLSDIFDTTNTQKNWGFGRLRDMLEREGYEVTQIKEGAGNGGVPVDFTTLDLTQYDCVVMGSNNAEYSQAHADAFEAYVRGGGAALFFSDANYGSGWSDAPSSDQTFLDRFGMVMNQDNGTYILTRSDFLQPDHPILNGVDVFDGEGVSPISLADTMPDGVMAKVIVRAKNVITENNSTGRGTNRTPDDAKDGALLVASVQSGRVAAHFDRNTFFNVKGAGTSLNNLQNRQYAVNLFAWLTGREKPLLPYRSTFFEVTDVTNNAADAPLAFDRNPKTRWATRQPQTRGQSITIAIPDTFSARRVRRVVIDAGDNVNDYPREYLIEAVAPSGTTSRIARGQGEGPIIDVRVGENFVSAIRITQLSSGETNNWWSIEDFRVYGPEEKELCGCGNHTDEILESDAIIPPSPALGQWRHVIVPLQFEGLAHRGDAAVWVQSCQDLATETDALFTKESFGKISVGSSVTPILTLPDDLRQQFLTTGKGITRELSQAALAHAIATLPLEEIDIDVIHVVTDVDYTDADRGVGGVSIGVLPNSNVAAVLTFEDDRANILEVGFHEFGHAAGMAHSNGFAVPDTSTDFFGDLQSIEYADDYDIMGGRQVTYNAASINAIKKNHLGWLEAGMIQEIPKNAETTVRVYQGNAGQMPTNTDATSALAFTAALDSRVLWFDFLPGTGLTNAQSRKGLLIREAQGRGGRSALFRFANAAGNRGLAEVGEKVTVVGKEAQLAYSVVASGEENGLEYLDVTFEHGPVQPGISRVEQIEIGNPSSPEGRLDNSLFALSASSSRGRQDVSKMVDGDPATRWTSGQFQAPGQTVTINNTGQILVFDRLVMDSTASPDDSAVAFSIFETDGFGNRGSEIFSGTGDGPIIDVQFDTEQSVDAIVIELTGSKPGKWWSIHELALFDTPETDGGTDGGDNGSGGDNSDGLIAGDTLELTASVSRGGQGVENMVDGDLSTRWSTGQFQNPEQFVDVNFQEGAITEFNRIVLDATPAAGDAAISFQIFELNNSGDPSIMLAEGTTAGGNGLIDLRLSSPGVAPGFRIQQTGTSSSNWWSIYELSVYNDPNLDVSGGTHTNGSNNPPPPPNDGPEITDFTLTAALRGGSVGLMRDGDLSTRWSTGQVQTPGQSFDIVFNSGARAFNQLILNSENSSNDFARSFQVHALESDGSLGSLIIESTSEFPLVDLRLDESLSTAGIRVTNTGSSPSFWWSIHELEIKNDLDLDPSRGTHRAAGGASGGGDFTSTGVFVNRDVYYWDFGPSGSPTPEGATVISNRSFEGFARWEQGSSLGVADRGAEGGADARDRDFGFGSNPTTFVQNIDTGRWLVEISMRDPENQRDNMNLSVEGINRLTNLSTGGSLPNTPESFVVDVTDNELTFEFSGPDGWIVSWLRLTRVTVDPTVVKLDFGSSTSPVEPEYLRISDENRSGEVFWNDTVTPRDRGASGDIGALNQDLIFSPDPRELTITNLPNGSYQLEVTFGDRAASHDQQELLYDGNLVLSGVFTQAGEFVTRTSTIEVTDGQAVLTFRDGGGGDANWAVTGLTLTQQ